MSTTEASRREIITSLAFGAGALTAVVAPTAVAADEHDRLPVEGGLRHVHRRLEERRRRRLAGAEPMSREGLHNLVAGLQEEDDAITEDDRGFFDDFIEAASDFLHVDEIEEWFSSTHDFFSDGLTDLPKTMFEFVREQFTWVRENYDDVEQIRYNLLWSLSLMIGAASAAPVIGLGMTTLAFVSGVAILFLPAETGG